MAKRRRRLHIDETRLPLRLPGATSSKILGVCKNKHYQLLDDFRFQHPDKIYRHVGWIKHYADYNCARCEEGGYVGRNPSKLYVNPTLRYIKPVRIPEQAANPPDAVIAAVLIGGLDAYVTWIEENFSGENK